MCPACTPDLLRGALTIAPDGRSAYVFDGQQAAVKGFAREPTTGIFTPAPALGFSCPRRTLCDFGSMTVGPEGGTAYLISGPGVLALARDPAGGGLRLSPGRGGCVTSARRARCVRGRGLDGPSLVLIPPDGGNAYAISDTSIAVFARAAGRGVGLPSPRGPRDADSDPSMTRPANPPT